MDDPSYSINELPEMWNFVLDTVREGRRKSTVHALLEIDVTNVRQRLRTMRRQQHKAFSLTAYLLWCYAKSVEQHPIQNSYRRGKRRYVTFDDVDVAVMVRKEIGSQRQTVPYILRAANRKTFLDINEELQWVADAPLEEIMPALDRFFFHKVPGPIRQLFWWFSRRNPWCKKRYAGTVGLTSLQMFGSGVLYPLVITPMTTTLAIGSVTKKPAVVKGQVAVRDILHCVLSDDHEVVDGGAGISFTNAYRQRVESCLELPLPDAAARR